MGTEAVRATAKTASVPSRSPQLERTPAGSLDFRSSTRFWWCARRSLAMLRAGFFGQYGLSFRHARGSRSWRECRVSFAE